MPAELLIPRTRGGSAVDSLWLPDHVRESGPRCHGCGMKFGPTQGREAVRHMERCPGNSNDALEEEAHPYRTDPIAQRDEEQVAWLKRDAIERGLDPLSHGPKSNPKRRRPKALKGVVGT